MSTSKPRTTVKTALSVDEIARVLRELGLELRIEESGSEHARLVVTAPDGMSRDRLAELMNKAALLLMDTKEQPKN